MNELAVERNLLNVIYARTHSVYNPRIIFAAVEIATSSGFL